MNVAEVARAAGMSPSGVRWYESIGALPPAPRSENGYRQYGPSDVSQLRLIVALRRLGLSVQEAGRLAKISLEGEAGSEELLAALHRQRDAIAERRTDLEWLDRELGDLEVTWRATGAAAAGRKDAEPISVLFLCNANSGRSQIGEALLARLGGARFAVQSAGREPAPVSELAVTALLEAGIDWHKARSKALDDVRGPFDYVIAMSESMREACAAIDGRHSTLHWDFPDPGAVKGPMESRLDAYRRVRDEVSRRLVPFVELALRTATGDC
jgi:arsenate reductase